MANHMNITSHLIAYRPRPHGVPSTARVDSLRLPALENPNLYWSADITDQGMHLHLNLQEGAALSRLSVLLPSEDADKEGRDGLDAVIAGARNPRWETVGRDLVAVLTLFIKETGLDGADLEEVRFPKTAAVHKGVHYGDHGPLRVQLKGAGSVCVNGKDVPLWPDLTVFRLLRPVFIVWLEAEMARARADSLGVPAGRGVGEQEQEDAVLLKRLS